MQSIIRSKQRVWRLPMKTETRGIIKSSPWTAEKQGRSCAAARSAAEEAEDA